ncbi:MAG TPA: hypothetical protein DIW50_16625, partial [Prolixibacteraceae bacterium]|nr:hypothetical protein [Prolixibacteraceae bacterium]
MKKYNYMTISAMLATLVLLPGISLSQVSRGNNLQGELGFQWPEGKKMAVSFTFDDARFSQADNGLPLFDKYGVKA